MDHYHHFLKTSFHRKCFSLEFIVISSFFFCLILGFSSMMQMRRESYSCNTQIIKWLYIGPQRINELLSKRNNVDGYHPVSPV